MNKWKPINTAPGGKRVLVYCGSGVSFVASFEQLSQGQAVFGWLNTMAPEKFLLVKCPTHWMPLPADPAPARVTKTKPTKKH